jgi:hypothetical protein
VIYLLVKFSLSAAILVAVSELAKRSSLAGALLASLPMTTLLALIWLWRDTGDVEQVARLSSGVFWLVLPSLVLLAALPALLRLGVPFWASLCVSSLATAAAYGAMVLLLRRCGVAL